jgi:hypothetical protein
MFNIRSISNKSRCSFSRSKVVIRGMSEMQVLTIDHRKLNTPDML